MDESKSDTPEKLTFWDVLDFLWIIAKVILILFLPAIIVGSLAKPIYSAAKQEEEKRAQEYARYGCYPVEHKYELCGPVEGKPGFTRCETKTEKICPDSQ